MKYLDASVTGTPRPISISIQSGHMVSTTAASIMAPTTTLDVGDAINISLGFVGDRPSVFSGYVKQIEYNVPENTVSIAASDRMIRAVDYFIVADDPNAPLTYQNKSAESLVQDLMGMAGLTNFTHEDTYFTFGPVHEFTVNLVPVYDYCRAIADALTWHVWCDIYGVVHFENRKPYIMTGDTGQPHDTVDERLIGAAAHTITNVDTTQVTWSKNEANLRNRVVVYGADGVHYTASAVSPFLPAGFYKSVVADLGQLINTTSDCHTIADYNLNLLNRLTYSCKITALGDPSVTAREVVRLTNPTLSVDSNWYVYACEHQWGSSGYTMSLDLRQ